MLVFGKNVNKLGSTNTHDQLMILNMLWLRIIWTNASNVLPPSLWSWVIFLLGCPIVTESFAFLAKSTLISLTRLSLHLSNFFLSTLFSFYLTHLKKKFLNIVPKRNASTTEGRGEYEIYMHIPLKKLKYLGVVIYNFNWLYTKLGV